jgi:hypothetical protein
MEEKYKVSKMKGLENFPAFGFPLYKKRIDDYVKSKKSEISVEESWEMTKDMVVAGVYHGISLGFVGAGAIFAIVKGLEAFVK